MANTLLLTNDYHVDQSLDYINDFGTNALYFFVGDFTTHANSNVSLANNTLNSTYYDVFNKMIMGKLVTADSIILGIKNIPYEAGTVYTQYDDTIDLTLAPYYCIVNAGSYSHVYKCLYNNNNQASNSAPNFSYIVGANTTLYETSDGYQWKYLFTVDDTTVSNFATSSYFPVIANTSVAEQAVDGSINVIQVMFGGKLYDNYFSGTFQTLDIRPEPSVY